MKNQNLQPIERFNLKHTKLDNGCWLWNGKLSKLGLGSILIYNHNYTSTRFSYMLFIGDLPEKKLVFNKCDTKGCVNPMHLYLGSSANRFKFTPTFKIRGGGMIKKLLSLYKISETGCWEWQGYKVQGYGKISQDRKDYTAHRLSYKLFIGELEDDMLVCHSCDNPGCISPFHLFKGTHKDNTQDAINKKRHISCRTKKKNLQENR